MLRPARAYGLNIDRMIDNVTIVNSADDIRRNVTLAMNEGRPCVLRMGSSFAIDGDTVTLASSLKGFYLDGCGTYRLIYKGDFTAFFTAACSPCVLSNLAIQLKKGSTCKVGFKVTGAPFIMDNVDVDCTGATLLDLFGAGTTSLTNNQLIITTCTFLNVKEFFALEGSTVSWRYSQFADIIITRDDGLPIALGEGATGIVIAESTFERIRGPLAINLSALGANCTFMSIVGYFDITTNSNLSGHVFIACNGPNPTLSGGDKWVGGDRPVQASSYAMKPRAVTLNSAAPVLSVVDDGYFVLTMGAAASGSVSLSTTDVADGQRVTLYFLSVAGTAVFTDNVGNLVLSANFTPTADDILELMFVQARGAFVELGRSAN